MSHHSGLTLAYLGDAVYELLLREHFINQGLTKVDDLHKQVVSYTNAEAQASAYHKISDILSEDELSIFKRGRNAKTSRTAKSASISDYRHATGLEALFGYLYLNNKNKRIEELLALVIN